MTLRSRIVAALAALALLAGACTLDNTPEPVPPTPGTDPTPTTVTALPPPPATPPAGDEARVVEVVDGDSLVVEVGGREEEVRLIGINTPERDECYGDRAREALVGRLGGQGLTLVADGSGGDRDQFGRLLRYAYSGPVSVNLSMIRNGFAWALSSGHRLEGEYRAAEDAAFAESVGLWGPGACGGPPVPTAVDVVRVEHDPPGPDEDDLNGEFAEIRNDGEQPAAAGGWVLRDESSVHRYVFPEGFSLPPDGETVRVHVGCGTDTAGELFWCADGPVWNNGGDTAVLTDAAGTVIARLHYEPGG